MKIIVYATADGDILRNVLCPDGQADIQCGDGEAWIEHEPVDDVAYKIDLATLTVVPADG